MTPEDLSAYLHRVFPGVPDEVQAVLLDYLQVSHPILYPKRWAFRRVIWRKLDQLRKVQPASLDRTYPSHSASPAQLAEQREQLQRIKQLMLTFPLSQQEILTLMDFKPPTHREIAMKQKVPIGTAGTRLFSMRKKLRQGLERLEPCVGKPTLSSKSMF